MNQLRQGIRTEAEHKDVVLFIKRFHKQHGRFPSNKEIFKRIAQAHLKESPTYYTQLKKYKL